IGFDAAANFVCVASASLTRRTGFRVRRVNAQRVVELRLRFSVLASGAQDAGVGGVQVGAFRIDLYGKLNRAQGCVDFSLAQADRGQAGQIIGIAFVDGQDFAVRLFRFLQASGPGQDTRTPRLQVQVFWCAGDLRVEDA